MLDLLGNLPTVLTATDAEALSLIEERRLMGRGLGWVDIHLLASALLAAVPLWTMDRPLAESAAQLGLRPPET